MKLIYTRVCIYINMVVLNLNLALTSRKIWLFILLCLNEFGNNKCVVCLGFLCKHWCSNWFVNEAVVCVVSMASLHWVTPVSTNTSYLLKRTKLRLKVITNVVDVWRFFSVNINDPWWNEWEGDVFCWLCWTWPYCCD